MKRNNITVRKKLSAKLDEIYCIPANDTNPDPDIIDEVFRCENKFFIGQVV